LRVCGVLIQQHVTPANAFAVNLDVDLLSPCIGHANWGHRRCHAQSTAQHSGCGGSSHHHAVARGGCAVVVRGYVHMVCLCECMAWQELSMQCSCATSRLKQPRSDRADDELSWQQYAQSENSGGQHATLRTLEEGWRCSWWPARCRVCGHPQSVPFLDPFSAKRGRLTRAKRVGWRCKKARVVSQPCGNCSEARRTRLSCFEW
jgi:hypothetical protein